MAKDASVYTRSSMKMGREIHQACRVNQVNRVKGLYKEYGKVPGIRPDFIDLNNQIIYELKPYNPRSIKQGLKQLERYEKVLKEHGSKGEWKHVLDLY